MEGQGNSIIAPFIMKTYQMVSDPTTERLITWGKANNSFLVVEPLEFSHRILPVHFKHNNFSSFVRQLNTYGFRKVDPDRWEFANEWFLRGQKHLLKNITRRKHSKNPYSLHNKHLDEEEDEDEEMAVEIARLQHEQRDMEIEMGKMNKRLEATEKRPQQMMNFLYKVAGDPKVLPRLFLEKEQIKQLTSEKKRRLMISTLSLSPPTSSSTDAEVGASSSISSPEFQFYGSSPSPETPSNKEWLGQGEFVDQSLIFSQSCNFEYNSYGPPSDANSSIFSFASSEKNGSENNKVDRNDVGYFGRMEDGDEFCSPPYPFSLFGGGF